ncbi:MAG: DUF4325 domain-containing protein [Bacteroidia bacterium]
MNTKTVVINLMDTVAGTATTTEGLALYLAMSKAMDTGKNVKLSLKDCTPLSSSFLNSTFGELYDRYGYDKIKERVVLINYFPSHAMAIKKYLQDLNNLVS